MCPAWGVTIFPIDSQLRQWYRAGIKREHLSTYSMIIERHH